MDYNEVVNNWFRKLHTPFVSFMKGKFSTLSFDEIEDLYADTFISIFDNIQSGKIKEETTWKAYIFQIGYNKAIRKLEEREKFVTIDSNNSQDDDTIDEGNIIRKESIDFMNESTSIYDSWEVKDILYRELKYMPEPCATIISLFYYDRLKLEDIAASINYKNTDSVKSKKNQCMNEFKKRMDLALSKVDLND